MGWKKIATLSELENGQPLYKELEKQHIGLFVIASEIHAIEAICPHAFALLTQGLVDGEEVECPLHQAVFHIPTGELKQGPGKRNLKSYPVKTEGDSVYVNLGD